MFCNYHIEKKKKYDGSGVYRNFRNTVPFPSLLFSTINHCKLALYNHRDLRKKVTEPLLQASSRCAKLSATYSINTCIYVKCQIIWSLIIQNYKKDRFLVFRYGISWTSVHRFSNSFLYIDGSTGFNRSLAGKRMRLKPHFNNA